MILTHNTLNKSLFFTFLCSFIFLINCNRDASDKKIISGIYEVSCGQCNFGLEGNSCDLAIRIDGEAYFVKGTDIDNHGDAHAINGFCNSIRKAKVEGTINNNVFKSTSFELLEE